MTNGNGTNGTPIDRRGEIKAEEKTSEEVTKLQQLSLVGKATGVVQEDRADLATGLYDICPECGVGSLAYEEGCRKCYGCGYAEC